MRTTSTMARPLAVLIAIAAVVFAGAAIAATKTHKLAGPVAGDANAKVKIQVVVKNGEPRKVKKLTYKNLDTFCDHDDEVGFETAAGDRSGSAGKNLGPKIESDGSFRWVSYPTDPDRTVNVIGVVKQKGKKVGGLLEVFFNDFPTCKAEGEFGAIK
jgi:hypothetical protein